MIEHGSFRDPAARVFYHDGRVFRGLDETAAAADRKAREVGLLDTLVAKDLFVESWPNDEITAPEGLPATAVIESRRVPTINYPSEWSFAMLRDAALATLDANLLAMEQGFILKDASAFNVVYEGTRPLIIDITSLEEFGEKGIWTAYGQFCDHFLAPLMLEAHAGIAFQRYLSGQTEGIPIVELNRLLRGRSGIHKGILSHVRLRSRMEQRAARMDTDRRRAVGRMALPRSAVIATMQRMKSLVSDLESSAPSTWATYEEATPYEQQQAVAKTAFVDESAGRVQARSTAVDVGANAGLFTKILARHFEQTLGIDFDPGAIDALYAETKRSEIENLTPLVIDITNPTPAFGWQGRERKAFTERVRPDFATWLAVVHHLSLGAGIPLESVVATILDFSPESVVEFVSPDDPMAKRISASRTSDLAPYSQQHFEEYVAAGGKVVAERQVSPTRTLYHIRRHGD
ncbi:MAG: hypothetical protein QNJ75_06535 [Acidimicrobiia bacterium]|nr:hypothetical protein [Acidimicrobiia bacterium]